MWLSRLLVLDKRFLALCLLERWVLSAGSKPTSECRRGLAQGGLGEPCLHLPVRLFHEHFRVEPRAKVTAE